MADVGTTEGNLLTSKWGPAPVWVWMLGGLVIAWIFAKWRDMKNAQKANQTDAASNAGGDYAAEGQNVAPQFIIENNMPQDQYPTPGPAPAPSQPVITGPQPPAVTTLPGTISSPPIASKPTPTPSPVSKPSPPKTSKKPPKQYKVVAGDSLSKIAAKEGVKGGWETLWAFNTTPGNRPASTITTLKKRGPNKIYPGETILIPQ